MTRPKNVIKYCLKCGSNEFTHDGNRLFHCQNCGFDFYINSSAAVAAVIVDEKGRILLTIRAFEPMKGYLDLPGGFVDPMESAENAVIREIKEELNLDVTSLKFLASFPSEYIFSGYSVYTTDLGFVAEVENFDSIKSNDDVAGFVFEHPDDIDYEKISSKSIESIIKYYHQSII
jgi:NAD+ diphosphatase